MLDDVLVKVVDRVGVAEFVEEGLVDVELEVWIGEVEDAGFGVVVVDKSAVELVDAKVEDSVLDSIELLGKVASEANVVDLGIQRGASSKRDFVVLSRSARVEEFSFSPPDSNIEFISAPVFSTRGELSE